MSARAAGFSILCSTVVAFVFSVLVAAQAYGQAGKLTNQMAQRAITQFANPNPGDGFSVEVLGVLEQPQQNTARVDARVSNLEFTNSLGTQRQYEGPLIAIFSHYNDGRWVLTQVMVESGGAFGTPVIFNNLNVVASGDSSPANASPAPSNRVASAAPPTNQPAPATRPQSQAAKSAPRPSLTDPTTFCATYKQLDGPDARYVGPDVPDWMLSKMNISQNRKIVSGDGKTYWPVVWRCSSGFVVACEEGASHPICGKRDTTGIPTDPMRDFCQQQPNFDFIPAAATSGNSIYDWSCQNGTPVRGRQIMNVDAQGYQPEVWKVVRP